MSDAAASREPVLLEETTDGVRLLTLNRAARKNALSSDLVQALIAAFEAAAADDAALALGLVGEVAPVERFDAVFRGYCRKIAEVAPIAARQTKCLVTRAGLLDSLEAHLHDEITLAARALGSADGKEAVRAIFEKRKPVFTGR